MGKKRKNIPVVLMLILLVPMSAFSQKYGAVKGKVTDADSKERLMYATIVIKGTTRGTTSDIEGKYILTNLAPGEYTLDFSFIGYEKVERTVQVEAGKTVVVNVELRPRSIMGKEVLNDKETYLETFCSAIFVLAMARGITHGWLDTSFLPVVEKGWEGLTSKISADGIVSGIFSKRVQQAYLL